MSKQKKKILLITLSSIAGVALLIGVGFIVRHSLRKSHVMVVSALEQQEYEAEDEDFNQIEGVVSSGASQSIYLSADMPVKQVMVTEGQEVKKGDVLLVYDTTKAKINAEKEELNVKRVENSISIAQRNINTLQHMKPDNGGSSSSSSSSSSSTAKKKSSAKKKTTPSTPKKDDSPAADPYKDIQPVSDLTGDSTAYNAAEANVGTETNPYRFFCTKDATIHGTFMQKMKKAATDAGKSIYFVIEVRKDNKRSGAIEMLWMHDASQLPPETLNPDWTGTLGFAEKKSDNGSVTTETAFGGSSYSPRLVLLAGSLDDDEDDDADYDGNDELISANDSYTSEELSEALAEQRERLANLQINLREAQLKLKKAKDALAKGEAKATADGVVRKVGDPANPPTDGSAFLQVGASKGLTIQGGISERSLNRIQPGDRIRVNTEQSGTLTAKVDDISPYPDTSGMFYASDESSSIYPFTAVIVDEDAQLNEGEWVQIELGSAAREDNGDGILYVSKAFIREDDEGKYVLKRGEDKRLVRQSVEVGKSTGSCYEVLSGITDEDWIAFPYGKNVAAGAKTREGTMDELYEE